MIRSNRKGFTLVEIMIVVAIIGLLAAIAIPNFVTARTTAQQSACHANLRTIQGALELARFTEAATIVSLGSTTAVEAVVEPTYIRNMPSCPTGGAYTTDANGVLSCATHGTP